METDAAEKHIVNDTAKADDTKVLADSNSDGVSGYRGLNHHGRNHEASYFRDSCYFHVTTLAYRSAEAASSLRKQKMTSSIRLWRATAVSVSTSGSWSNN